jgi:BMFP domain-containing protein YqiC
MQTENPMIADFVKVLNSAAGTLAGLGREAGETAREKAREVFGGFDFVSREEFRRQGHGLDRARGSRNPQGTHRRA